jgi:GNAT superfamily N-acetyltransferase
MRDTYCDAAHGATVCLWQIAGLGGWLITRVEVNRRHRGKGVASRLLDEVCADADRERATLLLAIEPDGTGLGFEELEAFYRRRGFIRWNPGDETSFVRDPKVVAHVD